MTAKQAVVHCLVVLLLLLGLGLWTQWYVRTTVERALSDQENAELDFWRSNLIPLYGELRIVHKSDPKTKSEVFAPLFQALEQCDNRISSEE